MPLKNPVITDGLKLEPISEDNFRIIHPDGRSIETTRLVVSILLYCTGQFDFRLIEEDIFDLNPDLPGDSVESFLEQMVELGFVTYETHSGEPRVVISLGSSFHKCEAAGRCCQNILLGPLRDAYVTELRKIHSQLAQNNDALKDVEPVQKLTIGGEEGWYLNRKDNVCIYYDTDQLCMIHKEFGEAEKPIACRLFPWVVVWTERNIRIAAVRGCVTHYNTYRTAARPDLRSMVELGSKQVAPSFRRSMLAPVICLEGEEYVSRTEALEDYWMELMSRPNFDPLKVLVQIADDETTEMIDWERTNEKSLKDRTGMIALLESKIKEGCKEAEDAGFMSGLLGSGTQRAEGVSEILRYLDDHSVGLDPMTDMDIRALDFARDTLRRWFFLREYFEFPGPVSAAAMIISGAMIASGIGTDGRSKNSDEAFHKFGNCFADWLFMISGSNFNHMYADDDGEVARQILSFC